MKKFLAAALISVSAMSATAGSVTFEAPQDVIIEVEPNMGIGGSWIIPAVIAAVILLAVTATADVPG